MPTGPRIPVTADTRQFEAKTKNMWTKFKGQAAASAKAIGGSFIAQLAAFELIKKAISGIVGWMEKSIELSGKQIDSEQRVASAIASTGGSVKSLLPYYKKLASAIQKKTKYGDEDLLQSVALYTRYGVQKDQMVGVMQATVELASKTGNLQSATDLLAKAAVGETSMLSRYGIIIDKNTPKSEKFAAALDQINKRFGGQAEADAATYAGRIQQLSNSYGDLKEAVGTAITKNKVIVTLFDRLSKMLSGTTDTINGSKTAMSGLVSVIGRVAIFFVRAGGYGLTFIMGLRAGFQGLKTLITIDMAKISNAILTPLTAILKVVNKTTGKYGEALQTIKGFKILVSGYTKAQGNAFIKTAEDMLDVKDKTDALTAGLDRLVGKMVETTMKTKPMNDAITDAGGKIGELAANLTQDYEPEVAFHFPVELDMPEPKVVQTKVEELRASIMENMQGISQELGGLGFSLAATLNDWIAQVKYGTGNMMDHIIGSLESVGSMLAQYANMMQVHNKKEFKRQKQIRMASVIMDAAAAIMRVWVDPSWPMAIPLSALIAAQAAMQLSQIKSQKYKGQAHDGMNSVPMTGSYYLEKGERVVPEKYNHPEYFGGVTINVPDGSYINEAAIPLLTEAIKREQQRGRAVAFG